MNDAGNAGKQYGNARQCWLTKAREELLISTDMFHLKHTHCVHIDPQTHQALKAYTAYKTYKDHKAVTVDPLLLILVQLLPTCSYIVRSLFIRSSARPFGRSLCMPTCVLAAHLWCRLYQFPFRHDLTVF